MGSTNYFILNPGKREKPARELENQPGGGRQKQTIAQCLESVHRKTL